MRTVCTGMATDYNEARSKCYRNWTCAQGYGVIVVGTLVTYAASWKTSPQETRMSSSAEKSCPHIGVEYNPIVLTARDDLHALFERMRSEEPVCYSPIFKMWLVSRYEDILRVVHDPDRFTVANSFGTLSEMLQPEVWKLLQSSHTFTAPNMFTSDLEHDRLRGPFSKLFAANHVGRFEPMVRRIATELLDAFPREGVVDYVQEFAFPFPLRVIMDILGIPVEDLPRMREGADAVTRLMTSIVPAEEQMELAHHVLKYEQYWLDLIAERRVNPGEDIISSVLRDIEAGEGKLSIPELVSTISANLVLAGHETTARALGNSLYLLMTQREHWQAIMDDPKIIPKMVDELLRFDCTVMGFFRTTTEDVEIGGVTIPKGAAVFPIYNSANVEATRFPEPNKINPQRPNLNEQLGFGRGIHFCLGAHLARLELRIALESLSRRWPKLHIAPGARVIHAANLTQRGPAYLPLALE